MSLNKPVRKGEAIDEKKGQWKGINEAVYAISQNKINAMNAYTMMEDVMTSCGCFESSLHFCLWLMGLWLLIGILR